MLKDSWFAYPICINLTAYMKPSALAASPVITVLVLFSITPDVHAQCGVVNKGSEMVSGTVYNDLNQDGQYRSGESGVARVSVSNGCEVVLTNSAGLYEISLALGQILFVSQPTGYVVPVDEDNLSSVFYRHYPDGTFEPGIHSVVVESEDEFEQQQ